VLGGTGLLYGLNTVGAAGGALLAGFVLLPGIGFTGTLFVGVGANLAVAVVALLLDRGAPASEVAVPSSSPAPAAPAPAEPAHPDAPAPALRTALLALAFGGGISSMLYQLGWTRALVLSFGSSTHAFTLIVSTFILGLGLGGLLAPSFRGSGARLAGAIVILEALVGFFGWTGTWALADLPLAVVDEVAGGFPEYGDLLFWQAGRAARAALPGTFAMGALFPLLIAALAPGASGASRAVGRLYTVNTAGVVLGSLVGGMLILPSAGTRAVLVAASALNFLLAAGVAFAAWGATRGLLRAGLLAGIAAAAAWTSPPWPPEFIHAGAYIYGAEYAVDAKADGKTVARVLRDQSWDMPFHREGRSASVAVVRNSDGSLYLRINGKTDASSTQDMDTQLLVGHLPMLVHPAPKRVLVVGLATGASAGACATHGVERLDAAEIAAEVAEAEPWFREANRGVVSRPGVRVLLEDGRTHLEHSGDTYDVVVSQPTNPWIAGVSDLFTVEYFRACRARLAPGGVVSIWVQAYRMRVEDFRLVLRTVRSVFPNAVVFEPAPWTDFCVVATADDAADPLAMLAARAWPTGEAAESLASAGTPTREAVFATLFLDRAGCAAAAEGGAGKDLHTDDLLQIEFRAPRAVFTSKPEGLLRPDAIENLRSVAALDALPGDPAALKRSRAARARAFEGLAAIVGEDPHTTKSPLDPFFAPDGSVTPLLPGLPTSMQEPVRAKAETRAVQPTIEEHEALLRALALDRFEDALGRGCRELWISKHLSVQLVKRGSRSLLDGDYDRAEEDFRRVRTLQPWNSMAPFFESLAGLRRAGDRPDGPTVARLLALTEESLRLNPRNEAAFTQKATLLRAAGRIDEAEAVLVQCLAIRGDSVRAAGLLALVRRDQGRVAEARALVESALLLEPRNPALLKVKAGLRE
ncbi:MAG TPA: tetratricopeptide repeat protein, partial [Planctomycetota bacterium]|nr:tetratricopeptide repeat protein [Planctomycetota bacterium]